MEEALFAAVYDGDAQEVTQLLRSGANPNCLSANCETPLIEASRTGKLAVVLALLKYGRNGGNVNINIAAWYNWTALDAACKYGHTAIVEALRDAGAVHFTQADLATIPK